MIKDRFLHHCLQAEAGRDAFVAHPSSNEEGRVIECNLNSGHLVVQTPENEKRCWDYHECEDLDRPKVGPML
ncbi:MAG: hypothetical protein A2X84_02230 [Desulfuromonadaceae bacterium GWC2_58_13]|nr:MAG: hypothetical protein A2X84_02230 [Desulfuromonadaceae bacterium GWC2_58_13]